jgi:hypothetical protein
LPEQEAQTQPAAVARPTPEPTQPRGPREEDRGTTDAEAEDPCNGAKRDGWTEDNPYGRGLQTPRLPSPCVGGAVSLVILAATAGPPRSSSAPAAKQRGCCPESVDILNPFFCRSFCGVKVYSIR